MSLKLEDHAGTDAESAHADHGMPQTPRASFWAAGVAQIVTRPLDERDHACGNEVVAYPPLSSAVEHPAGLHPRPRLQGPGLERPLGRPQLPQQLRRSLCALISALDPGQRRRRPSCPDPHSRFPGDSQSSPAGAALAD